MTDLILETNNRTKSANKEININEGHKNCNKRHKDSLANKEK